MFHEKSDKMRKCDSSHLSKEVRFMKKGVKDQMKLKNGKTRVANPSLQVKDGHETSKGVNHNSTLFKIQNSSNNVVRWVAHRLWLEIQSKPSINVHADALSEDGDKSENLVREELSRRLNEDDKKEGGSEHILDNHNEDGMAPKLKVGSTKFSNDNVKSEIDRRKD
ncbi:hypothetical protein Q3G72_013830 [Acer saccharum]|nr:hypothetical protein Q3G72_013830 [Acer saccharum]